MRNLNLTILSADDSVSQTSSLIDANQLIAISFHAFFGDASANGTVKVQASNDICNDRPMAQPSNFTPTNWVDIPNASATVASGASALITIPQCCYRWLQAVWTNSSGGSTKITVNIDALSI